LEILKLVWVLFPSMVPGFIFSSVKIGDMLLVPRIGCRGCAARLIFVSVLSDSSEIGKKTKVKKKGKKKEKKSKNQLRLYIYK